MKKLFLMISLLGLCLTGCGGKEMKRSPKELADAVLADLNGASFKEADADYVENSFDFENAPDASALYFGEEFGVEFGVFSFADNESARKEAKRIEEYLKREEQSVRDLAALYPAAELSARLARYKNASVRVKGNTVAYFLLSDTDRTAAEAAFIRAVK